MPPLQKEQCITVDVESLVYGGEALAHYEGYDVLVPRGVPGDRVSVRIIGIHDSVLRTEIEEIVSPSPSRVQPECPGYHDGCGGCQWLQVDYREQLRWKKRVVQEVMGEYDELKNTPVGDVAGMDYPFFYRNKMVVRMRGPRDNLRVGFHTSRTKWVINVFNKTDGQCHIQNELNNRIGRGLAESLTRERLPLKSATVRTSESDEVTLDLDRKLTTAISADLQDIGTQAPFVHYVVGGHRFRVTSPSFFQANTAQTGTLVQTVMDMLPDLRIRTAVDLYCGVGLFTLFLADRAEQVYGIEESHTAIADAEHNAAANRISNIRFIRGKAEDELQTVTETEEGIDLVIVDPPRSGCDPDVLRTISSCEPERMIYISCNVKTLARDLALLRELGYQTTGIRPVDMFPHTYHIECVAMCEKL